MRPPRKPRQRAVPLAFAATLDRSPVKFGTPDLDLRLDKRRLASSPGLSAGTELMRQEEPERGDPIRPLDWRKVIPFQAVAASDCLGWVGLEAARYRASTAWEYNAPALTHHRLVHPRPNRLPFDN